MLEYISVGLAVVAGISTTIAIIYRKGRADGIDSQCETNIKNEIKLLGKKVESNAKANDNVHSQLFSNVQEIGAKIDKLQGSNDVIKDLIVKHLTK